MALTTAAPEATVTVEEAQQRLAVAQEALTILRERNLSGDKPPGVKEWETAGLEAESAARNLERAQHQAAEHARLARLAELQAVKEAFAERADAAAALDAGVRLIAAWRDLLTVITERNAVIEPLVNRARGASAPQVGGFATPPDGDDDAGLAWTEAGMGRSRGLVIDGRARVALPIHQLFAALGSAACRDVGLSPGAAGLDQYGGPLNDPLTYIREQW
jgi:hypothetical protein